MAYISFWLVMLSEPEAIQFEVACTIFDHVTLHGAVHPPKRRSADLRAVGVIGACPCAEVTSIKFPELVDVHPNVGIQ